MSDPKVPLPAQEAQRLEALLDYRILDTPSEQSYDDLTSIAATICQAPIALISFIDTDRQWFKSRVGLDASETPRESAFCAHAILEPGAVMVVSDATQDPRFADNPLVTGAPHIRFYAGAPMVSPQGQALGTLCVIDREPRAFSAEQHAALKALSRQVVAQLELRRSLALAQAQTLRDGLTGAGNRRAFDQCLEQEWSRGLRTSRSLSLLMIDVDLFKHYNDRHGHPAGDEVLRRLVQIIAPLLRKPDHLARYGGEEFAVILPEAQTEAAARAAERIRAHIEAGPWALQPVTVSIGIATAVPQAGSDPESLLTRADAALYEAKRAGRNCYRAAVPG